jgi:hypothetical protein
VYYVPKLERNIISLGQLTERGCKIVLEENHLWGYDRQKQLIIKVERSKNRLYYLDLDRVDPICDGFLVEEQRSAPFPCESMHVTQDVICEENSDQLKESLANSRPPWPEESGLKEKDSLEEAITSVRRQTRYACLKLLNIAVASITKGEEPDSNATLGDDQASNIRTLKEPGDPKHTCTRGSAQPEAALCGALGDASCSLAKRLTSSCGLWPEKFQDLGSVSRKETRPEAPPETRIPEKTGKGGWLNTLARKTGEEYVVSVPIALEPKQLRPMLTRMRCVFDCYPKEVLRTTNNLVKMKHKMQCLLSEEPVKTEDANKKDGRREATDKPTKLKSVTWVLRGTTKAMSTRTTKMAKEVPRVTPTRSKWHIWDPGRSEAVVLRGVIIRIKHDPMPEWQHVHIVHVYK